MSQISIFDGADRLKINKPVRLIELFAGIGAQSKALERIEIDFEHYRVCEIDKYAVSSYNAIHGTNFPTSDITELKGEDLGIVNTDEFDYILTYSYPCTSLSLAGKKEGMAEGSGTKSSLLWEVKRLLTECDELPRILLLENVPQILNEKNNGDFYRWIEFLESKGYQNKWCVMNAKEYGVPQNRERCFMVSWLGDYYYDFPKPRKLEKFMRDLYEPKVDEKYYLSEKGVKSVVQIIGKYTNIMDSETDIARHTITAVGNANWTGNFVADAVCVGGIGTPKSNGGTQWYQQDRIYEGDIALAHPATLTPQGSYYYLIEEPICYDEQNNRLRTDGTCGALTTDDSSPKHNNRIITAKKIRRLTPRECFRLMDFDDCDFDKVRPIMSDAQLYKQAGNSIVVNCLVEIFKEMI